MDQKETGCETPQVPVMCANNCGFFGSATTMNLCSKCYKDTVITHVQEKLTDLSLQGVVNGSSTSIDSNGALVTDAQAAVETVVAAGPESLSASPVTEAKQVPNRCGACKKRVGLTGFTCKCRGVFCSTHRYSDKHECTFDYRTAGQEAIAKANPLIKADKLENRH